MRRLLDDKQHLVRMALLFVVGFLVFLVGRVVFVPHDFGVYGHYRAGALADNRARPLGFAGQGACSDCHSDVVDARVGSKHQKVSCEACHGPLARHVADAENVKPVKPDPNKVCLTCHLENVAKPASFPQVNAASHAKGQPCSACHPHHHPDAAKSAASASTAGPSAGVPDTGSAAPSQARGAVASEVKP
jgi:hypothetical protein